MRRLGIHINNATAFLSIATAATVQQQTRCYSSQSSSSTNTNLATHKEKKAQQQSKPSVYRAQPQDQGKKIEEKHAQASKVATKKEIPNIKVKKRGPWGEHQLRDSWSEDANARYDMDSVGQRIEREYRYHPYEKYRKQVKWMVWAMMILCPSTMLLMHRFTMGYWLWQGDPQHFLNMIRATQTSPRSKYYYYRDMDYSPQRNVWKESRKPSDILGLPEEQFYDQTRR